jgi:hypothetical protein
MNSPPDKRISNTPEAFLDFIKRSRFDMNSLRAWERETLSCYLGLTKDGTAKPPGDTAANPPVAPAQVAKSGD